MVNADLRGKQLTRAWLSRAALLWAHMEGADLVEAHLDGADLSEASMDGAYMSKAHLEGAQMIKAHLHNAELRGAYLTRANLGTADLSGAALVGAHLDDANLALTDLTDARFELAFLKGVFFEPKTLPPIESLALAQQLELMTYQIDPGPMTKLRKQFQDAGYREQERAITYVLNRHDADPARLSSFVKGPLKYILRYRRTPPPYAYGMPLDSFLEGAFKWIAFDLTCRYGLNPGRPLRIILWLWVLFSLTYATFMHGRGPSGIYFIGSRVWRGKPNSQGIQIRPRAIRAAKWWNLPFLSMLREWRVLRAAMFFSLMSAFNIGFRDINFGRWLRMLTKREYDLKAVGWARTVSGLQALISVYMVALWVLSYFGRPFG